MPSRASLGVGPVPSGDSDEKHAAGGEAPIKICESWQRNLFRKSGGGGGIVFSCETGSGYASRFVLAAVAWGDGGMAQGLTAEPSDWRCVTGKSLLT